MKKIYLLLIGLLITVPAFSQGGWSAIADMPHYRLNGVGLEINGKGYVITGTAAGPQSQVFEYDPATDTWTQKADFPGGPRQDAFGFTIGGKGYIGGGWKGTSLGLDFWEYDPATDTWTQKSTFPTIGRVESVSFSIGNKGYVTTGFANSNYFKDLWEYDPVTDTWTQKTDFAGSARDQALGFVVNGKAYVGLGLSGATYRDWYEYDPATDSWTQIADYPLQEMAEGVTGTANGKGYVGLGAVDAGIYTSSWFQYNPVTDTWTAQTDFPDERVEAQSFSINDLIYVAGGSGGKSSGYVFDPTISGIAEKENKTIAVSPNPATDQININIPEEAVGAQMVVYNLVGQPVLSGEVNTSTYKVSLDGLANGYYFIKIDRDGEQVGTGKFILQN